MHASNVLVLALASLAVAAPNPKADDPTPTATEYHEHHVAESLAAPEETKPWDEHHKEEETKDKHVDEQKDDKDKDPKDEHKDKHVDEKKPWDPKEEYQHKNGTYVHVTKVVNVYTTFCPEPTTFEFNHKQYKVDKPTTLTITDCPCTVVEVCSALCFPHDFTDLVLTMLPQPTFLPGPAPSHYREGPAPPEHEKEKKPEKEEKPEHEKEQKPEPEHEKEEKPEHEKEQKPEPEHEKEQKPEHEHEEEEKPEHEHEHEEYPAPPVITEAPRPGPGPAPEHEKEQKPEHERPVIPVSGASETKSFNFAAMVGAVLAGFMAL